jgi:arylformamidase
VRIHDVSLPISHRLPVWPGDPPVRVEPLQSLADGDVANVSRLDFSSHTGTHIDAPLHFLMGGRPVDQLPLEVLVGACRVVYAEPGGGELTPADVPERPERLLIKTPNSRRWAEGAVFDEDFIGVGEALARALVESGVKLLGVDYLGVERFDAPPEHPVHKILLKGGVVIVEGLDLSRVEPGDYELCCLPLRIAGGDGAPCRALLIDR